MNTALLRWCFLALVGIGVLASGTAEAARRQALYSNEQSAKSLNEQELARILGTATPTPVPTRPARYVHPVSNAPVSAKPSLSTVIAPAPMPTTTPQVTPVAIAPAAENDGAHDIKTIENRRAGITCDQYTWFDRRNGEARCKAVNHPDPKPEFAMYIMPPSGGLPGLGHIIACRPPFDPKYACTYDSLGRRITPYPRGDGADEPVLVADVVAMMKVRHLPAEEASRLVRAQYPDVARAPAPYVVPTAPPNAPMPSMLSTRDLNTMELARITGARPPPTG